MKDPDFSLVDRTRLYLGAAGVSLTQTQREGLARFIDQACSAGAASTDEHVRSLALDWCGRQQEMAPVRQPPLRRASMGYYQHGE